MAWQAAAAIAASALMKKMAEERAAMGQEFQQGFEEAESGAMDIGESVRGGMGQVSGFFANFLKGYLQSYGMGQYAKWRGGPEAPNAPAVSNAVQGQQAFQGMLVNQALQQLGIQDWFKNMYNK